MTAFRDVLGASVEAARAGAGYANYLEVREQVLDMLDAQPDQQPSRYWQEELQQFTYMFDAGPLVIDKLREHCHAITGLRAYDYRMHHQHRAKAFANKLDALQAVDPEGVFVPESPQLGGFGHLIDGVLVNIDTLKFYESLIALARAGELERLRSLDRPPVVMEIGSGWGGFALALKAVIPGVRLILVDLPQTFLFSGTYLRTLLPDATTTFHTRLRTSREEDGEPADIQFVAAADLADLLVPRLDLAVNMVSFQEMTTAQVAGYVDALADRGCPTVYSHNRDRSAHNAELDRVSAILRRRYAVREVEVLDVPYTKVGASAARTRGRVAAGLKRGARVVRHAATPVRDVTAYRHVIGRL